MLTADPYLLLVFHLSEHSKCLVFHLLTQYPPTSLYSRWIKPDWYQDLPVAHPPHFPIICWRSLCKLWISCTLCLFPTQIQTSWVYQSLIHKSLHAPHSVGASLFQAFFRLPGPRKLLLVQLSVFGLTPLKAQMSLGPAPSKDRTGPYY